MAKELSPEGFEAETGLLCGRDAVAGGCVLALSSAGSFAALTNCRCKAMRMGILVDAARCAGMPKRRPQEDCHLPLKGVWWSHFGPLWAILDNPEATRLVEHLALHGPQALQSFMENRKVVPCA